MCRMLQQAAHGQMHGMGLSISQVRELNRMWVLTRFAVNVFAFPQVGDEVSVETWATDRTGGVRAYRDFRMRDAEGQILAECASLWLLLDLKSRRLVRLPDAVLQIREPERVSADTVDSTTLDPPEAVTGVDEFRVRWSDLDENGHANNTRYIEWLLETVPDAVRAGGGLSSLDIQFVSEARPGETILAVSDEANGAYRHRLTAGDGRVLGIARTVWRQEG